MPDCQSAAAYRGTAINFIIAESTAAVTVATDEIGHEIVNTNSAVQGFKPVNQNTEPVNRAEYQLGTGPPGRTSATSKQRTRTTEPGTYHGLPLRRLYRFSCSAAFAPGIAPTIIRSELRWVTDTGVRTLERQPLSAGYNELSAGKPL